MTQERHGRNIARTIRFQQVTHTSFRSGCQENAMLFTACAIWMWCRWAKKKHEKKTYTLNVHRHNQATRIGWDERKSQQPCRHDGEGVFASLIPWQILRELRFRKERTIILLRLTKTDPNKWRMIWYTDIDCWYGFGVHISISILLIYILYIYILYIYATNVEPIVLMLVLASSGICLYESNVIEIKCEIHKDITNQASLISLAWCWDGSGWNKIPLECRP
jgi:hypothetical protein